MFFRGFPGWVTQRICWPTQKMCFRRSHATSDLIFFIWQVIQLAIKAIPKPVSVFSWVFSCPKTALTMVVQMKKDPNSSKIRLLFIFSILAKSLPSNIWCHSVSAQSLQNTRFSECTPRTNLLHWTQKALTFVPFVEIQMASTSLAIQYWRSVVAVGRCQAVNPLYGLCGLWLGNDTQPAAHWNIAASKAKPLLTQCPTEFDVFCLRVSSLGPHLITGAVGFILLRRVQQQYP